MTVEHQVPLLSTLYEFSTIAINWTLCWLEYIKRVWQCMNFVLYIPWDKTTEPAVPRVIVPLMCACIHMVLPYMWIHMNVCVCVCLCLSICCHPSGPRVRPPAGVHSIKAAAVAPEAPPYPPLEARPNLLPGTCCHRPLSLFTHTSTVEVRVLVQVAATPPHF